MISRSSIASALMLLSPLVTISVLAGCQSIPMIQTTGTRAAEAEATLAADVCRAWPVTPYSSSKDTPETVVGNRANNAARAAYCKAVP